jgi:hypothetical protein
MQIYVILNMCIILESVIKGKPILSLVCDLATAGRTFMYCWCRDGYNVLMKPKSLFYNKWHMGEKA